MIIWDQQKITAFAIMSLPCIFDSFKELPLWLTNGQITEQILENEEIH